MLPLWLWVVCISLFIWALCIVVIECFFLLRQLIRYLREVVDGDTNL